MDSVTQSNYGPVSDCDSIATEAADIPEFRRMIRELDDHLETIISQHERERQHTPQGQVEQEQSLTYCKEDAIPEIIPPRKRGRPVTTGEYKKLKVMWQRRDEEKKLKKKKASSILS